ncbi:UDP-4-amino-4,6-dideoxy-N-acetyl-beta-L-altrosamine transaminase, partial [bacterium]|nr:UDP-4-amino-4,6-dideoxy-N-acetyl-beta-L-altrosamine transaminase [bacterium]
GDWLTQGPKVGEFEATVAASCGARHAVACNSGTSALHLALLAAGIGPHAGGEDTDETISPATTFLATSNSALYAGAVPHFTDVDFDSICMTPGLLEPVLSEHTRAVLPVHFAGLTAPMAEIAALVRERAPRAVIIEDACHAPGGLHPNGKPVGSLGHSDMVMFSFHPVKHTAAGEAGIILTDRDDLAARLRLFRSHGMTKDPAVLTRPTEGPWYYEMIELGYNFRLPDMNAALGLSQWNKLPRFVARRREIAARYHEAFAGLEAKGLLQRPLTGAPAGQGGHAAAHRNGWHIYILRIDWERAGITRKDAVAALQQRRIGTQVHYYPVPLQPYYREHFGYKPGDFPAAEKHYDQALTIPLYPAMTDADVDRVVTAIHEILGGS